MKISIIVLFLFFTVINIYSQTFPVAGDITTTNGVGINIISAYPSLMAAKDQSKYVKINTKMRFQTFAGMTSLYIDYWGYGQAWRMMVGWYVYNNAFYQPSISIQGEFSHDHVVLANENGYVTISIPIPAFSLYGNLTVNSMTAANEPSNWMDGWSIDLEAVPGINNQVTVEIENRLSTDGNVGIGTSSPNQKLTVKGGGIGFDGNSADKKLYSPIDGTLEWMTHDAAATHGFAISHQGAQRVFLNSLGDSYLNGGNLGIGTTTPTNKLEVNGTIRSKKVKVEASPWPDYVFANGYQPMALSQLEEYIKAHKHLPEVPSAKEVETNGQDLGEIQATLLKKVEELTLYMIEESKAKERLQRENQELKTSLLQLKEEIKQIKNKSDK